MRKAVAVERRRVAVELRESEAGQHLEGVMLTEGRAASGGRREVFAPGSAEWPADGVAIRTVHHGPAELRAVPVRGSNGELRIRERATDAIRAAIEQGRKWLSVEFVALRERTTKGGVREVLEAFVPGAALTDDPEYDSTAAEVRDRKGQRCRYLLH